MAAASADPRHCFAVGASPRPPADLIEVDARFRRGIVEMRHPRGRVPTTRLWERWYLLPADTGRVALAEVAAAARQDTHMFIDLKGLSHRVSYAVLHVVGDRPRFTVASRRSRLLAPFAGRPGVDRTRSAAV